MNYIYHVYSYTLIITTILLPYPSSSVLNSNVLPTNSFQTGTIDTPAKVSEGLGCACIKIKVFRK